MKLKRFNLIVLAVLFVFVTTLIPMSAGAVVESEKTYYMDAQATGDGTWTVADGTASFGYASWKSAGSAPTQTLYNDARLGSDVMKVDFPGDGSSAIGTAQLVWDNETDKLGDGDTVWYEFMFRYDGAIVPFNAEVYANGANTGYNVFHVNADGSVGFAHPDYNDETGYRVSTTGWNHVLIVVDEQNLYGGSDTPFYVYINGTKVYSDARQLNGGSCLFGKYYTQAIDGFTLTTSAQGTIYLDNFKLYTTASNYNASGYDPTSIIPAITSSSLEISNGVIYAVDGTSIADIDAAIEDTLSVSYWDGTTQIASSAYASTDALGKKACVSNGITCVEYTIAEKKGVSYYDIDLETASTGAWAYSNAWPNKVSPALGNFTYQPSPSATSPNHEVVADPYTGSKSMKLTLPSTVTNTQNAYYVGAWNVPRQDLSNNVSWYEISVKYGDDFDGFHLRGNDDQPLLHVRNDGYVYIGDDEAAQQSTNFYAQSNTWYHFVIAVDNIDKFTNDNDVLCSKIYAWVNGTLITTPTAGEGYTSAVAASATASSTKFCIQMCKTVSSGKDSVLYVDNLKWYTGVKSVATSGYTPVVAPALTTSAGIEVSGSTITVSSKTKLSEIATLVAANDYTATYWDGTTQITAADLATTNAAGKTVCVSNGVMATVYTVVAKTGKVYYDIDLETGASEKTWPNKASSGFNFEFQSSPSGSYNPPQTPVDDAYLGSKVMKIDISQASAHEYAQYVGGWGLTATELSSTVSFYEISLRYGDVINQTRVLKQSLGGGSTTNTLFYISGDGLVYIGNENQDAHKTPMQNVIIVPNQWYHFVIAVDSIDKVDGNSKVYAWANGELLTDGTSDEYTTEFEIELADASDAFCLLMPRGAEDYTVYADNIKWYTEVDSVADSGYAPVVAPVLTISGDISTEGSAIKVPSSTKLSSIADSVASSGYTVTFWDDTTQIATNALATTDAIGKTVCVSNGLICKKYAVIRKRDVIEEEKVFNFQVDYSYGDEEKICALFDNATASDKTFTVVFATYAPGGALVDVDVHKDITVTAGLSKKVFASDTIDMSSANEIKVFVWDALDSLKPVFTSRYKTINSSTTPELGELDIPIDTTALAPNMSVFTAVPESISTQSKPAEVITDYSQTKATYKDCICVVSNSSNLWVKNGKYTSEYKFIWDGAGEHIIGAAPTLAAFANMSYEYNEATQTATIGNITAEAGENYIIVDGKKYISESDNQIIDGVLYIPLKEFVRYGMKKFYGESVKGFGVIATEEKPYHFNLERTGDLLMSNDDYSMMMAYINLDRLNAASLLDLFNKNVKGTPYPRISTIKEDAPLYKAATGSDSYMAEMSSYVLDQANGYLNQTVNISAPQGTNITGLPSTAEPEVMYYAYYMTGNRAYIDKVIENAMKIVALDYWSQDAHFLSTSAAASYLAFAYDLYRDEFTATQRKNIANALISKAIEPHLDYMYGEIKNNKWPYADYNWNAICNVGPMIASMVLLGEGYTGNWWVNYNDKLLLDCIEKAQVSLGYSLHYFAPDGCGWESPGYNDYTLGYLINVLESVNSYFGESLGIINYLGLEGIGRSLAMTTGKSNNWMIHCEDTTVPYSTTNNMYFTKMFGDYVGQKLNLEQNYKHPAAMRRDALNNMKYYMPNSPAVDYPEELDALYTSSQIGMSRDAWGDATQTVMGVHGGYNFDAGLQVDIGNFFYEVNGKIFADDPGIEDYSVPTNAYPCRAEGANVWVVNPDETAGQSLAGYGDLEMVVSKPDGVIYTLDLTSAYADQVQSALRGYMLSNNRKVFTVQDEIKPVAGSNDFYWFWHTRADININQAEKKATLTLDGETVTLYFDSNVDFTISKQDTLTSLPNSPVVPGQLQKPYAQAMHKIVIEFASNGEPVTFRAVAVPNGQNFTKGELMPVSEWAIPAE